VSFCPFALAPSELPALHRLFFNRASTHPEAQLKPDPLKSPLSRSIAADGLKIVDLQEGRGQAVAVGVPVTVHFDCVYKGLVVVSSRSARLLGGNRTLAEPLEFVAGGTVSGGVARVADSSAGGLFSGQGGPRPPPALSTAVIGMKVGGKVRFLFSLLLSSW
jgi:hypothetical protein